MKATIKKRIKNLTISLACTATILSALGASAYYALPEIVHADNSSRQQTIELQEHFDAVTGYRQFNNERLQHNNGEPIYVTISDEFTKVQRDTIISALDQIFGVVGDINDNYKYVLVDNVDSSKYLGKTTMEFRVNKDLTFSSGHYNGVTDSADSLFSYGSKGRFNQKCWIEFDAQFLKDEPQRLYYTSLHEILHNFGFDDVYTQNKTVYQNTFMNPNTNMSLKMITPNDYKLLVAMYSKDMSKLDETEKEEYVKQLEQKIDDYTTAYYSHYQQAFKQGLIDKGFSEHDVEANTSYVQLENDIDVTFIDTLSTKGVSKIRVKVKGDKYMLATYDENDNLLENCSGKTCNVGGQIFLQDVQLQNLKRGKQTCADLCVEMRTDNTKYYRLRDTVDTMYSAAGISTEHYNQQNQVLTQ